MPTSLKILIAGLTSSLFFGCHSQRVEKTGPNSAASIVSDRLTSYPPGGLLNANYFQLAPNQSFIQNGLYLTFQTDGNLVLYTTSGSKPVALWSTQTGGRSCATGCIANFQSDSNLVLYQNNVAYWASNSANSSLYRIV